MWNSENGTMKPYRYLGRDEYLQKFDVDAMWKKIPWERRSDSPRNEAWFAADGRSYTYGKGRGVRTYESIVKEDYPEFSLLLGMIWCTAEIAAGEACANFLGCFINGYLDGTDHLGWHSDDGPDIDDRRPIAVVTFGAEREIWLRPKDSIEKMDSYESSVDKIKLEHGSIFIMEPGCQQTHQHRIPKASFICGPRISFTFRGLKNVNP